MRCYKEDTQMVHLPTLQRHNGAVRGDESSDMKTKICVAATRFSVATKTEPTCFTFRLFSGRSHTKN